MEAVFGMPGSAEFAQDFAKYGRFKQMKSNPNARECSRCSELCNPPADATYASASAAVSAGSSSAQSTAAASDLANKPMKCKCGHAFCWEHGDLHPGQHFCFIPFIYIFSIHFILSNISIHTYIYMFVHRILNDGTPLQMAEDCQSTPTVAS